MPIWSSTLYRNVSHYIRSELRFTKKEAEVGEYCAMYLRKSASLPKENNIENPKTAQMITLWNCFTIMNLHIRWFRSSFTQKYYIENFLSKSNFETVNNCWVERLTILCSIIKKRTLCSFSTLNSKTQYLAPMWSTLQWNDGQWYTPRNWIEYAWSPERNKLLKSECHEEISSAIWCRTICFGSY